jgi:hypothetical protein
MTAHQVTGAAVTDGLIAMAIALLSPAPSASPSVQRAPRATRQP